MNASSELETDSAPLTDLNQYFLAGTLRRNGYTLYIEVYGVRSMGQLVIYAVLTLNRPLLPRSELWQRTRLAIVNCTNERHVAPVAHESQSLAMKPYHLPT